MLSYLPALGAYLVIGGPVSSERATFDLWLCAAVTHAASARRVTVPGLRGLERAEGVSPAVINGMEQVIIVSDEGSRGGPDALRTLFCWTCSSCRLRLDRTTTRAIAPADWTAIPCQARLTLTTRLLGSTVTRNPALVACPAMERDAAAAPAYFRTAAGRLRGCRARSPKRCPCRRSRGNRPSCRPLRELHS